MRYFRYQIGQGLEGLVRRRDFDGGAEFARLELGRWVRDQELARYFLDPGDVELVEVTEAEAQAVASAAGAELEAEAA